MMGILNDGGMIVEGFGDVQMMIDFIIWLE